MAVMQDWMAHYVGSETVWKPVSVDTAQHHIHTRKLKLERDPEALLPPLGQASLRIEWSKVETLEFIRKFWTQNPHGYRGEELCSLLLAQSLKPTKCGLVEILIYYLFVASYTAIKSVSGKALLVSARICTHSYRCLTACSQFIQIILQQ